MQSSPKAAIPAVIAKATHHQRGVGFSTAPAMRFVTQSKLRLLRTSGTRASGGSTEVEASPRITSGAVVGAPSITDFLSGFSLAPALEGEASVEFRVHRVREPQS